MGGQGRVDMGGFQLFDVTASSHMMDTQFLGCPSKSCPPYYTVMSSPKALGKSLSRESVIASYYIFLNRNEREWNSIEFS